MSSIYLDAAFYKELDDKGFQLLPHEWAYDQHRQRINPVLREEIPGGWSYEQFREELGTHFYNGDERAVHRLIRALERIEKGINLVSDVSEFREPDWIVEGIIVRNGLTMLYGESGAGKTTFCLYMTDAIQKGKDLFGLKCKLGSVIFIENDESAELLKSHRDKIGLPIPLHIANTDITWDASSKRFNKELGDILYYYTPDVLVIDAYTSLGIPDITRPESALVLDEFRRLAKKNHCAMVIIHHVNRSGEQMGSNLHIGKMDSIVSLVSLPSEKITLTQEKIRGSKFQPKVISFDQQTLGMTDAKLNIITQVKLLKAQGFAEKEIISRFPKKQQNTVKRYLRNPLII